jgi:hypothetical protein
MVITVRIGSQYLQRKIKLIAGCLKRTFLKMSKNGSIEPFNIMLCHLTGPHGEKHRKMRF